MKLLASIALIISTVICCRGEPYSDTVQGWPHANFRLSDQIMVGDLFDSGLKPFRRPGAENRHLHAKHVQLTTSTRAGISYPLMPVDVLRCTVLKGGLIGTMEVWTPPLTIAEARAEMRKWLPLIAKTENDLDVFLKAVGGDWLGYDIVNGLPDSVRFAGRWNDGSGPDTSVFLMKSWQWQAPVRLCFAMNTMSLPSRRSLELYQEPIPAPPGFESQDMTAPKDWDADSMFIPVTTESRPALGVLPPKYANAGNSGASLSSLPVASQTSGHLSSAVVINESQTAVRAEVSMHGKYWRIAIVVTILLAIGVSFIRKRFRS
jgi:hypothetical protein